VAENKEAPDSNISVPPVRNGTRIIAPSVAKNATLGPSGRKQTHIPFLFLFNTKSLKVCRLDLGLSLLLSTGCSTLILESSIIDLRCGLSDFGFTDLK
jgi:hypothetical protein